MKHLTNEVCEMFGDRCRHVSNETSVRPATKLIKPNGPGIYKDGGIIRLITQLGQMCNNQCEWVKNMCYCNVRWERHNPVNTKKKKDKIIEIKIVERKKK